MSVRVVSVVFISCDWPGCEAEEMGDPPWVAAARRAKALGWTVTSKSTPNGSRTARCPDHRNRHVAKAERTQEDLGVTLTAVSKVELASGGRE